MADCTCVEHKPLPNGKRRDTPCKQPATHRLKDPDGVAYLCRRHARALRDMYEPGQIRKLRAPAAQSSGAAKGDGT